MATERISEFLNLEQATGSHHRTSIDIIVPVYKSVELTTRCLESLDEHIHEIAGHNPRLIVINDSPGERDVKAMLKSFSNRHSYVTVLENELNLGFVGSVNQGLAIACKAGRDVLLVNADTETFPDTLKNLLTVADSDPQIGFVSPRSNNASFCSLPHFHGGTVADQPESHRRWQFLSRTLPAFHFTPTAVGFYLYIKHAILANFGFLDSEFGLGYEEENDLILRASKAGYRAALANHAFAYHAGSASFNLLDMNLSLHQGANLQKMAQRHAEYLPLVRRYEGSAHFRAERLLSHALPSVSGRTKIVFDLSSLGSYFNGTSEMSIAIIEGLHKRHSSIFEINVICTEAAFEFHELDRHHGLRRHEVDLQTSERFAIGIQLGQPFGMHPISVLEDLAVVNVFGMLDTIAEDCGYLSITHQLEVLWSHVSLHANGLFFNSRYSEGVFNTRFPDAKRLTNYARLLPTKLSSYKNTRGSESAEHVLIMGNHFAHKASDATGKILRAAFPTLQFVVLGKQNLVSGNLRSYRSGSLSEQQMESLYTRAAIVVLPSHVEGFGFGLVHALAAGKVAVARDIAATREILATYKRVDGVFLYANDSDIVRVLRLAMSAQGSYVDDSAAGDWSQWADGFAEYCKALLAEDDIFERLVKRIEAGDLLRKANAYDLIQSQASSTTGKEPLDRTAALILSDGQGVIDGQGRRWKPARRLGELLGLDGAEFICSAYVTLLRRLPDADGLENYLDELKSAINKLQIVSRLKSSTEGRRINAPLTGYRRAVVRERIAGLVNNAHKK